MSIVLAEHQTLDEFFGFIYGDETGYCYLAFKAPGNSHQFRQEFFQWPEDKFKIVDRCLNQKAHSEVYFAPALFSKAEAKKEFVKGAYVFWAEFDGTIPKDLKGIPNPSLRVRSSADGHEHWYWRLDSFVDSPTLEKANRALAYMLGADSSGWDANQILRPPETLNHKRSKSVAVVGKSNTQFPSEYFAGLPEPPPIQVAPTPEKIPAVEDVIARHPFSIPAWKLFKHGVPEGQRSDGLMSLGYYCAEMQMGNTEIFAILLNADARWGKFQGRLDRDKRLMEIVTKSRAKYPLKGKKTASDPLVPIGALSLIQSEVNLEWVWEGLLQRGGYLLLTGPSGVGKTQLSLDFGASAALGRNFLDTTTKGPIKIGFFSLEMGLVDLKHFVQSQFIHYTQDELKILEENLRFYPLGEPLYLNRDEEKNRIEDTIKKEGLQGIIIDSLGSTTEGELGEERDTKNLMDWLDRVRQQYEIFAWVVHHHRKATGENKKPNKLSDVYGSQYITARATTVLCLWDAGVPQSLDLLPLKIRLAAKPDKISVYRDQNLHFTKKVSMVTFDAGTSSTNGSQPKVVEPEVVVPVEHPNDDDPFNFEV
jgi:AAA domain-containing protein